MSTVEIDPGPLLMNAVPAICADCEAAVYAHELGTHECEDRP